MRGVQPREEMLDENGQIDRRGIFADGLQAGYGRFTTLCIAGVWVIARRN